MYILSNYCYYSTCYCENVAPYRPSEELVFTGTTSTGEILQSLSLANNTLSAASTLVDDQGDSGALAFQCILVLLLMFLL